MTAGAFMEADLLARLNAEQKQAVTLHWGPSLVLAGAGSGKTTVLTRRIAYLISALDQDPDSILAVTFTNKAAGEMKQRIEKLLGFEVARRATIGTFHSICARILRREIDNYESAEGHKWTNNFVIYDETESLNILKAQIQKLNLDDKVFVPKVVRHEISSLKNDGFTSAAYSRQAKAYRENRISEIFAAYQADMARNNALDFDDLILIFNDLMQQNPNSMNRQRRRFRHVLVDEYQDTNRAQYDLVNMLCSPNPGQGKIEEGDADYWHERSLMVVGDVDQSIYSWRKADFRIILGFQNDFKNAQLIKLEENYRSTENILDVANSIIQNNTERIEKVLRCNRGKGGKSQCYEAADEIDEAYYVVEELKRIQARGKALSKCLILYRTNAQSRAIEEVLVRSHIPYVMVGATRFYDRAEIKDVIAYLKLVYNPRDGQSFSRVINTPKRGIGKTSIDKLSEFAAKNGMSMIDAASSAEMIADISPKTVRAIKDFADSVLRWQMFSKMMPVSQLLETILQETKYIQKLEEDALVEKDELAQGRIENVRELVGVAKEFEQVADEPDLDSFLTRISLVSDLDAIKEGQDSVTLMTLHAAKGLEFSVVFLMGMEDGLFPHMRSLESPAAIEEERRLMYVGVTRAEDMLYLTLARKRMLIGRGAGGGFSTAHTKPSRFLKEIAPGLLSGYYPAPEPEPVRGYQDDDQDSDAGDWNGSNWGSRARERSAGNGWSGNSGYAGESNRRNSGSSRHDGNSSSSNRNGSRNGANQGSGTSGNGPRPNRASNSSATSGNLHRNNAPKPRAMRMPRSEEFIEKEALQSNATHAPKIEVPQFELGDIVQHATFGTGKVIQVIGEKDKALYNIHFETAGKKVMDPKFAKMIKLCD